MIGLPLRSDLLGLKLNYGCKCEWLTVDQSLGIAHFLPKVSSPTTPIRKNAAEKGLMDTDIYIMFIFPFNACL